MMYILVGIICLIIGISAVIIITRLRQRDAKVIAQELISQTESQKVQDLENIINRIKDHCF